MWSFESMYKDQIKWQKRFWPQYQFVMSKKRTPSVFFLKIYLFQTFIAIFTLKMYSFFICQFKWISNKIFYLFTFVKILPHSPAQDFLNKKKPQLSASSVGSDIPPTIYKVLTQTRYTLCAHCRVSTWFIKGTVSRDFRLLVFSWISFPQSPEYTIRAVSIFF